MNFTAIQKVGEIRELIHGALEYLHNYADEREEGIDFRRAFAATDTLLDVSESVYALREEPWPASIGMAYLLSDGILQMLIKQQDAVQQLAKVFNLQWKIRDSEALTGIRDRRNQTTGHPVHHSERRPNSGSTFLVRQSPGPFKVATGTYFDKGGFEHTELDLTAMIEAQHLELLSVMRLIWGEILVRFPEAAHFRWSPWIATERLPLLSFPSWPFGELPVA